MPARQTRTPSQLRPAASSLRVLAVLIAAAAGLVLGTAGAAFAAPVDPPPIVVAPGDPTDSYQPPTVDIGAHDPGTPGSPGRPGTAGTRTRAGGGAVCSWVPAPAVESWLRHVPTAVSNGQTGRPAGPPGGDRVDPRSHLYQQVCDGVPGQLAWFGPAGPAAPAVVLPTPAELAGQAYAQLRLPTPTAGRSPDLRLADGRAAVLVGEQTWLWTDPARYTRRAKRVRVGPVWAQVTAVPVALSFDPGNGDSPVRCAGPGTPFRPGLDRPHAASPTCGYQYRQSSAGAPGGMVRAEYAITWRVRWVGSTGTAPAAGLLPDLISRTTAAVAVAEAQALNTD
jgi:hypothetical protein